MSYYDYVGSRDASLDYGFYALLMAAMRRADTDNARRLRAAFPEVWDELFARYDAPSGYLPGEVQS